jgi:hypothetical protein
MKRKEFTILDNKMGESPGAIMSDGSENYLVKLGLPEAHSHYTCNSYEDLDNLIKDMSRRSCEEKIFFNLAEALGSGEYVLPKTDVVLMKPKRYQESSCSIEAKLSNRFQIRDTNKLDENFSTEMIVNKINNTEIVHFTSELITSYQDIGSIYKYHIESAKGDLRQDAYKNIEVPDEPRGMGGFFAISCVTGNYDCIGNTGGNAGISIDDYRVIIVDGGNIRISPDVIIDPMPASSDNQLWISYECLSATGKRDASKVFSRIINLDDSKIRKIITNDEEFRDLDVFTESEVVDLVNKFKQQQLKLVEVFYDKILEENYVTPKIQLLKDSIKYKQAEKQVDDLFKNDEINFPVEVVEKSKVPSFSKKRKPLRIVIEDDSSLGADLGSNGEILNNENVSPKANKEGSPSDSFSEKNRRRSLTGESKGFIR